MKKVAFIIQHLTNGGAERTISNLSMILDEKCELYLIVFDGKSVTYPYKGTLIDLELPPQHGKANKIVNVVRRIKTVRKLKKQYQFDCVISFMFGANIVNVLSGHVGEIITSVRNYMSMYGTGIYRRWRERFLARKSDLVVALSKMVEIDLNDTFGIESEKTVTIYNPCDTDRIKQLAQKECPFSFDSEYFYFITAGRMVHQKGQWHILKAFSEMKKRVQNIKLIILGSGQLENELKKLTQKLNIKDDVYFIGFVDNPYAYIFRSNCFVLPSLFEGLGNVILEAMACNVPVVSYDCLAGPRELISPETDPRVRANGVEICSCGVLVPLLDNTEDWSTSLSADDEKLSAAMYELYSNPKLSADIVTNATNRLNEFTNEHIAYEWMNVINGR